MGKSVLVEGVNPEFIQARDELSHETKLHIGCVTLVFAFIEKKLMVFLVSRYEMLLQSLVFDFSPDANESIKHLITQGLQHCIEQGCLSLINQGHPIVCRR